MKVGYVSLLPISSSTYLLALPIISCFSNDVNFIINSKLVSAFKEDSRRRRDEQLFAIIVINNLFLVRMNDSS